MSGRRPSVAPDSQRSANGGAPAGYPRAGDSGPLSRSSPAFGSSSRFDDASSSNGGPPSRPERRRPVGSTPSPATLQGGVQRFPDAAGEGRQRGGVAFANSFGGPAPSNGDGRSRGGAAMQRGDSAGSLGTEEDGHGAGGAAVGSKSRRMMDQLNFSSNTPPSQSTSRLGSTALQQSRRDSASSQGSETSSRGHSGDEEEEAEGPQVATTTLNEAITAFTSAGARRDGRRGGLADQGYTTVEQAKAKAAHSTALNPNEYPDTPAFREVEAVLKKVAAEWPVLMYGTSAAPGGEDGDDEKDFDPVSLALGLLDSSSVGGANFLPAFLRLKSQLDAAISSTLASSSSSYRAYESSITTHNSTLQSLSTGQRQVAELKKTLGEAREKLEGKGREGLVGMWNRMSHLEEMGKILDEM